MEPEKKNNCRIILKLRKQQQRRTKAVRNIINDTPPSSPSILQEINLPQEQNESTPSPSSPAASLNSRHKKRGTASTRSLEIDVKINDTSPEGLLKELNKKLQVIYKMEKNLEDISEAVDFYAEQYQQMVGSIQGGSGEEIIFLGPFTLLLLHGM